MGAAGAALCSGRMPTPQPAGRRRYVPRREGRDTFPDAGMADTVGNHEGCPQQHTSVVCGFRARRRQVLQDFSAASTSWAWPSTFTLGKTFRIFPSTPMMYVVRTIPIDFWP